MALDHQKLDVYRHSLALLKVCDEIIQQLGIVVPMLVKLVRPCER